MADEDPNRWLTISTEGDQGGPHVPGPPESPDIVWVGDSGILNPDETVSHQSHDSGSIIIEDSGSDTDGTSRTEPFNPEETDSSDTEVAVNSPAENFLSHWESEEDTTLNVNSVIIIERESDIVQEPSVVSVPENPNAGVENPIIRLENPDYEPEEVTDNEASRGSSKRSYNAMMCDDDDGQTCPVCLDSWTNAGAHRLSSLKCGHLFGRSCISRWLSLEKKKHCPQCNKKANPNDIRELYATKLIALDATEKNRLEKELEDVKEQKRKVELELMKSSMTLETCRQQLDILKARVTALEGDTMTEKKPLMQKPEPPISTKLIKFHLEKSFGIQEGSCRVSAFSPLNNILIVSQQIRNSLFRGYGVKKISKNGNEYSGHALMLHKKALRDVCFHPITPNLILTVSFDKSAKLTNIEESRTIQTFQTDHALWSCCWDSDDPNIFYTGAGNGIVSVYDVRRQSHPILILPPLADFGAVVALRYAPADQHSQGGLICCRLNSIVYYQKISATEYNPIRLHGLTGPFFSLCYDPETSHLLVSCRPSPGDPLVKHIYCELQGTNVHKLFSFHGGNRQTLLCRSCFIRVANEPLCAVFQENTNSIELWSISRFAHFQSIPVSEHILDIVSIKMENRNYLATVSDSMVRFFEGPT